MVWLRVTAVFQCTLVVIALTTGARTAVAAEPADGPRVIGGIQSVPASLVAEQILREAYGRMDLEIEVAYLPSRRARYLSRLGRLDGELFRIRSMENEYTRMIRVPAPILMGYIHCVVKDSDSLHLCRNLSELDGLVAIHRGVRIAEEFVGKLGLNAIEADRYPQMASLVKHGRVEAAIVSSIEGIAPFNWPDWATLAISEPLEQFELFHYIHHRHREEARQLAGILEQMSESGWTGTAISQFIDSHSDKVIISGNFPWPQGE